LQELFPDGLSCRRFSKLAEVPKVPEEMLDHENTNDEPKDV
jgi:hypothetical protein